MPLDEEHDLSGFTCGIPELDSWLREQARRNQRQNTSQTFVVTRAHRVVGYYALSANAIARLQVPKALACNTPDPIPVLLLGRLAVDQTEQGSGLGGYLLRDALIRSLRVTQSIGARAVMVAAISEEAAAFYRKYEFLPSPIDPLLLFLPMKYIRQQFEEALSSP